MLPCFLPRRPQALSPWRPSTAAPVPIAATRAHAGSLSLTEPVAPPLAGTFRRFDSCQAHKEPFRQAETASFSASSVPGSRKCACGAYLGATSNSRIDSRRRRPRKGADDNRSHLSSPGTRRQGRHRIHARAHVPKPRAPDSRGRPAYLTQQGDVFFVDGGFRGWRARRWLALGLGQVEAEPIDPKGRAPTRRGT